MALDPGFTIGRWSAAVGIAPDIVDTVIDVVRRAGLSD